MPDGLASDVQDALLSRSTMSERYLLLSPLSFPEFEHLVQKARDALEEWFSRHPEYDVQWEYSLGEKIPAVEELRETLLQNRPEIEPQEVALVEQCHRKNQSIMTLESEVEVLHDPLQVSLLRYMLDRIGDGLVVTNGVVRTINEAREHLHDVKFVEDFALEEILEDDSPSDLPDVELGNSGIGRLLSMLSGEDEFEKEEEPEVSAALISIVRSSVDALIKAELLELETERYDSLINELVHAVANTSSAKHFTRRFVKCLVNSEYPEEVFGTDFELSLIVRREVDG